MVFVMEGPGWLNLRFVYRTKTLGISTQRPISCFDVTRNTKDSESVILVIVYSLEFSILHLYCDKVYLVTINLSVYLRDFCSHRIIIKGVEDYFLISSF